MPETVHARNDRALEDLVVRLRGEECLAVDTEFLRERTYYPKVCLVQLGTPDLLATVDPLTVDDLSPLWELLSGDVELLLHAATQDLEIIQRAAGGLPARIFDTQLAAAFLGWGNSLGHAHLVRRCTGVELKRAEGYTDWSRRPLRPEQVDYALDDVRYLHRCHAVLVDELRARDRLDWVQEELRELRRSIAHTPEPTEQWLRVSGGRKLRGRRLAVLRSLAAWREREASRRDVPRKRVVPDRALVGLARRLPESPAEVEEIRGLHPKEARRSAATILERIAAAAAEPQEEWPAWPASARPADPSAEAVTSLLDGFLRQRARELELSVRLLGSRSDLGMVVRAELEPGSVEAPELLRGWRRRVAGEDVLRLLRGDGALRVGRDADDLRIHLET